MVAVAALSGCAATEEETKSTSVEGVRPSEWAVAYASGGRER